MLIHLLLCLISRHPAAVDHSSDVISILLGKLSMASGPGSVQDLLHGPPSVLCHHKLGYHDLHQRALRGHMPHHVVCFQSQGGVHSFYIPIFYLSSTMILNIKKDDSCNPSPFTGQMTTDSNNYWLFLMTETAVPPALPSFCMDHFLGVCCTVCTGLQPGKCLHPGLHSDHTRRRLSCFHHV